MRYGGDCWCKMTAYDLKILKQKIFFRFYCFLQRYHTFRENYVFVAETEKCPKLKIPDCLSVESARKHAETACLTSRNIAIHFPRERSSISRLIYKNYFSDFCDIFQKKSKNTKILHVVSDCTERCDWNRDVLLYFETF